MKIATLATALLALAPANEIPADADLPWQFNHSTDVAQVRVLGTHSLRVAGRTCGMIVWEVSAIQTFKGDLRSGQHIHVWGPNDPSYWQIGGERLMFLRHYDDEGYNACSSHLFAGYKQVHWGCCEIRGSGPDATVLFGTMINSEQAGPDIPVQASQVYAKLRSLQ
jgi:hypothetical protein